MPMNAVLERILQTRQVETTEGQRLPLEGSEVPDEEGRWLQELVEELRPAVSLEVGLAYGISAMFICEALAQQARARHLIIDPYQETSWQAIGLTNLRRAGYGEFIEFYPLPSHQALPQLEARGVTIDFAFVDGWHTFDHGLVDFFYLDRMLRVGGVVVLDDTDCYPGLRKLCRFIVKNRAYSVYRCSSPPRRRKPTFKHQAFERLARASGTVRRLARPEALEPDGTLGLAPEARCIAFQKEADDARRWDFHQEF